MRLQKQPFDLLVMLLERPGGVVTREKLQKGLWPRKTFGDFEVSLNKTVRRLARYWVIPLRSRAISKRSRGTVTVSLLPSRKRLLPVHAPSAAFTPSWQQAGSLCCSYRPTWADFSGGGSRAGQSKVVPELPFANLSRDPGHEYFADGVTDALITKLGKSGALRVISRQSVQWYKKGDKSLPEISQELNADRARNQSRQSHGGLLHPGSSSKTGLGTIPNRYRMRGIQLTCKLQVQ